MTLCFLTGNHSEKAHFEPLYYSLRDSLKKAKPQNVSLLFWLKTN